MRQCVAMILWLRRFKRETGVVVFLVASLAVSLASATVVLTLSRSVLWRELPFSDSSQLVKLEARTRTSSPRWLSLPEFHAIADGPSPVFEAIAGYTVADFVALSEPGRPPQPLLATMVSARFFDVLRIQPQLGALPAASAFNPGGERVVLLSHELWQRRYRGAAGVVGTAIRLSGPEYLPGSDGMYRIAGILPRDLWLFWKRADVVIPLRVPSVAASDANAELIEHVIARLAPSADLNAARAMSEILRGRAANAGATNPPVALVVDSLRDAHFRDQRPQLQLLLAVAGVVVLLSVTNIVIAAMAQAISRRRETAVRVALGGGAWRLFIDTAQENAITAAVAGAAGLGLGIWLTDVMLTVTPPQWLSRVPGEAAAVRLDSAVLLTLVGILTGVALSATFAIQWFGRHSQPWCLLNTTLAPQTRASRLAGMALVAAEIALCTCAVELEVF
jgi:putative ABC transport system permease protein